MFSTVGSAGIVDPGDISKVVFEGSKVHFPQGGTVVTHEVAAAGATVVPHPLGLWLRSRRRSGTRSRQQICRRSRWQKYG